jgi:pyridoxal 5'-phosphate synthase pdxT subunit
LRSEEIKIGVLAIQGAFQAHAKALLEIRGVSPLLVRYPSQLNECKGLILPGGESTAQKIVGKEFDWLSAIKEFSQTAPILGTCAGLILMQQLGLLDIEIERNGFGSQKESFAEIVSFKLFDKETIEQRAIFIRAPRIKHTGSVEVLATLSNGEAICVRNQNWIGCTFHPELCTPSRIHKAFTELILQQQYLLPL